jgi:hypothetical protein
MQAGLTLAHGSGTGFAPEPSGFRWRPEIVLASGCSFSTLATVEIQGNIRIRRWNVNALKERYNAMQKNDAGKISASAALAVFVIGVIAIIGAATLLIVRPGLNKSDNNTVQADTVPFAARLDRVDGDIGIARQTGIQPEERYEGWTKATVNAPLSLGDRIYVRDGSNALFAINRNNYVRLNPSTSLDIVSLSEGHTQLALREGACVFDVGALASDDTYEVGTPNGAVDFTQPGLYQVGIDDGGDTVVSVLNGQAEVSCLAGSGVVSKGQLLTLVAAEMAEAIVSDLSPDVAGTIVSDYYSYRYPKTYDGRYSDYHRYETDPDYYERSYRRSASYQYIPEDVEIAGVEDLDEYGEWQDLPDYGHCWHPSAASSDWAPYRDGYWSDDHTLGLTWVSNEQWGWAPYHYGRWARVNQQWYWVPRDIKRHTTYAPSLVAFVSPRADEVGWVPLGPGDPYVPRYYDQNYQPRYAGSRAAIDRYVNDTRVVNYGDPAAVTVVSINQFTKVITPGSVLRTDSRLFRNTRPYGDPYAIPVIRQIARTIEASRPVVAVPLQSQQSFNRPVMMRRSVVPSTASDVVESLKVHRVPESAVAQKMKLKRIDQAVSATQANGIPDVPPGAKLTTARDREARIDALAAQAAQGNKAAKREMRQLAQQQQEAEQQHKAAEQQAVVQQQQLNEQQKAQKRAERQQAQQSAQQGAQQSQAQAAQQAEQAKAQKRAARQQAQQAEQQQSQPQAAQQAEQAKAQKRAARQQAQQAEQQQSQARAAQQAEQQKTQKRTERQQAQAEAQQAAQQAEQQKAQKRAAREQSQQAAQAAAQQQAQQAAARQQSQQEQRRIQKQAQQQAQTEAQQQSASQANPGKAEKRAEKAKNKNAGQ